MIDLRDLKNALNAYPPETLHTINSAIEKLGNISENSIGVASILAALQIDADCIVACLLLDEFSRDHDIKKLSALYGSVSTKLGADTFKALGVSSKDKTIAEAEKIRKMLFAISSDIRVIFICLAQKLYTMRTMSRPSVNGERQSKDMSFAERKSIAKECLDIYAPLASRLGLVGIKDEMEDLCLKNINRQAYNHIKDIVALKSTERAEFLEYVKQQILDEAKKNNIKILVQSRAKHFYSIYQKMCKRNKEAGELYDLFGLRIMCNAEELCYVLLGIVHKLWKPIDGRFKDYIAMPKSNGYQSLHTTVLAFDNKSQSLDTGNMLEIQIRTHDMHKTAEYGYASHWLYKKGKSNDIVRDTDLPIVNTLMKLAEEGGDTALDEIKKEVLKDSIFVWTPQGKVIELPLGSTPIDFAYSIHSAVGDHCLLAKADGIIIPLHAELKNTQIVEIVTSVSAHPNSNWLQIVKTSKARSKIRAYLSLHDDTLLKKSAEKNHGGASLHTVHGTKSEQNVDTKKKESDENISEVENKNQQIKSLRGGINPLKVRVQDEKNMMLRFAKCCNPILGDPIVGYVSRGRGIIVHRRGCKSIVHIPDFAERSIETEWEHSDASVARIKVDAKYAPDFFAEIEHAVKKCGGILIEGRLEDAYTKSDNHHQSGFFTLQLENRDALKKALKNIRAMPVVFNIRLVDF